MKEKILNLPDREKTVAYSVNNECRIENTTLKQGQTKITLYRQEKDLASINVTWGECEANLCERWDDLQVNSTVVLSDSRGIRELKNERFLIIYAAVRMGRVANRHTVLVNQDTFSAQFMSELGFETIKNTTYFAQRTDILLMNLALEFKGMKIYPDFYVWEIRQSLLQHIIKTGESKFFTAIIERSLTKQQYIYQMSQMYQFVRYTTRILGYCVAYSRDSKTRAHFASHLAGEVHHEKIIEADLNYLGHDASYVKENIEANVDTLHFILSELAIVTHFHDPIH